MTHCWWFVFFLIHWWYPWNGRQRLEVNGSVSPPIPKMGRWKLMPGDKTYPLSPVASICHRDSSSLTCSNARKIPARCREKMLLSLYQPRESFLWHLQSSQNQLIFESWESFRNFLWNTHTQPLVPSDFLCEAWSTIIPQGRKVLNIFSLVQSKKLQGPNERLKFLEQQVYFAELFRILFKEVAKSGGIHSIS